MLGYASLMMAGIAMSGSMPPIVIDDSGPKPRSKIKAFKKPKPIPKGSNEYFFNKHGEFSTSKMLKTECVFICVAINQKNAKRKFDRHLGSN